MSARGNVGMRIDLDRVPARESGMSAYELLLSESQERMLVVVEKGHEEVRIKQIFEKWDLHAEIIGEVIDGDRLLISYGGTLVAPMSLRKRWCSAAARRCTFGRPANRSTSTHPWRSTCPRSPWPPNPGASCRTLMATPNIASKRWVYDQYDSMVRTNNMLLADADAAVVLLKETGTALSMKTDCNGRYVYLNPRRGAMIAVAESARNVVCTGGAPVAITNCLNFGNPYKPEVYWQFSEAVAGMGEACRVVRHARHRRKRQLLQREPDSRRLSDAGDRHAGSHRRHRSATRSGFSAPGDAVILLGANQGGSGARSILQPSMASWPEMLPPIDLDGEKRSPGDVARGIRAGLVQSPTIAPTGVLRWPSPSAALGVGREDHRGNGTSDPAGLREDFYPVRRGPVEGRRERSGRHAAEILTVRCTKNDIPARLIGTYGRRLCLGHDGRWLRGGG